MDSVAEKMLSMSALILIGTLIFTAMIVVLDNFSRPERVLLGHVTRGTCPSTCIVDNVICKVSPGLSGRLPLRECKGRGIRDKIIFDCVCPAL